MSREWKPGDVGVSERHGYRSIYVEYCSINEHGRAGGPCWHNESGLSDPPNSPRRPLVVIDPEDREQVERLLALLKAQDRAPETADIMQAALREFANPTPPRIGEPGTWGVVEASCPHDDNRRAWIKHPDGNWWPAFAYSTVPERTPLPDAWEDLIEPSLVREGVDS